jgi:hypothetical protein
MKKVSIAFASILILLGLVIVLGSRIHFSVQLPKIGGLREPAALALLGCAFVCGALALRRLRATKLLGRQVTANQLELPSHPTEPLPES